MKVEGGVSIEELRPARRPKSNALSQLGWRIGLGAGPTLVRKYERSPGESFDLASHVNAAGGADRLPSEHFLRCPSYESRAFVRAQLDNVLFTRHAAAVIAPGRGFIDEFNVSGAQGMPAILLQSDFVRDGTGWRPRPGAGIEWVSGDSIPLCHYGQGAFGHFVLDGLLQIYLHSEAIEQRDAKVVHWPLSGRWPMELLALCGVDPSRQRVLRKPLALLEHANLSSAMAAHGVYFPAAYSVSFFAWLRTKLLGQDANRAVGGGVYIRRSANDARAVVNQEALEQLLVGRGFEILDPASTSVAEQARRIAQSERLMAPWGSGLTLAPLLDGRRQVFELTPTSVTDPWFLRQAAVHQLDYTPILHDSNEAGVMTADLGLIDRVLSVNAA